MIDLIKKLFGIKSVDFAQLVKEGAIILDVRTQSEFSGGHIKGSVNMPVNSLVHNFGKLKSKNKTIITCCASGMRSASAKSILKANGFNEVYNGGSWHSLNSKINR
jgi:phage shock protein E